MRPITTFCCNIFENNISSLEREDFLHKETTHHTQTRLSSGPRKEKITGLAAQRGGGRDGQRDVTDERRVNAWLTINTLLQAVRGDGFSADR